jgi:hypothetical protein
MFYVTDLDDDTQIVIEAATSGAFAKSDLEVRPNPRLALQNAITTTGQIAQKFATELRPAMAASRAEAEVSFSVKCDHTGLVMIAMNPTEGQFKVTLSFKNGGAGRPSSVPHAMLETEPTFDDTQDATDQ